MSKRLTWVEMEKRYVGNKYCGKEDGKQLTLTCIDVTLGGDISVRDKRYSYTWPQERWLKYMETAKQIGE